MSIKSLTPSNHLILCRSLLLPPSIFPSVRVFSNESVLPIRRPNYWSFSFSISPSNEHTGLISFIQQHYSQQARKKQRKQPKCPWMDEWKSKMWYWEKFKPITLLSNHHHIHFQKFLFPQTVSLCVCVCVCVCVHARATPSVVYDSFPPHGLYVAHQVPLSMELSRQGRSPFLFSLDDLSYLENLFTIALTGFQKTTKLDS